MKKSPSWPHDFVFHHEPSLSISDAQIREIAESLNVAENSEYITAVLKTIRQHDGRIIAMAELRSGDHRDHDIKTLRALACAMDGWTFNVIASLERYGVDLCTHEPKNVAAAAREAVLQLEQAGGRHPSMAKPGAKRKRGTKPMGSRAVTFRDLEEIYTKATGQRAIIHSTSESGKRKGGQPSGHFFRFLRAAVAPAPDLEALQDHALKSAFERATNKRK